MNVTQIHVSDQLNRQCLCGHPLTCHDLQCEDCPCNECECMGFMEKEAECAP